MKKSLLYLAVLLLSIKGFAQADIKVINTDYQDVYVPGSLVVYTVSVMNFGPSPASNVHVVNALPSGIFDFKWTGPVNPVTGLNVSGSNNQLDHTIATLAVGEVVNYTIKINVPASYGVNLVNETVISGPNVDPNPVCLQCKDIDTKGIGADVVVTNTNNQNYYTPGTTSVYTLKVKNNGPLKAVNVNVFNAIPAGITNFSWTGSNGSVGTNINLSNSILEIIKDAAVTYTITLDIPIGFTGNLVNQSSITATSQDLNLTNNTYTETDLPFPTTGSDIVITNTDNKTGYNPGGTNTYLVKVKNNGPELATNLQITNAIPYGITQFSWTGDNGSSGTNVALDNNIATLAVGAEVIYTIVLQVPLTRLTDLTSETVLTFANIDPNPNNSQYIDTDVLINTADVSVINTDNQSTYILGGNSVYTITVKNNGPHNATNVKIVNAIPAGITQFSWTGSNGSSGTNVVLNNTISNLLNGDTVVYTVTLQVPLTYTGNLTSTVVQTSATFDPTTCTQCVDVDTQAPNTSADVVVINTDNTTGYTIGETKNYILTVKNNGPANATNVVVTNPIPAGINTFSWTGNAGSGINVGLNNSIPLLLVGQSIIYNITLVVPAGFTGDIVSQASTTSASIDPNLQCANCTDIDSNTVAGGIKVVNTDNFSNYISGQSRTYIITVTNNGATTATNIVIQDLVSNGLSQSDVSWSGNSTSGIGDLNNTIATLAVGQTITYTIIVNIPSNYNQSLSLFNQVTFTSDVPAANPPCLKCLDIDTPNPSADLVISKSDNRPDFLLSQNGAIENNVYTVVIANNGPSDAVNVLVSDLMPPGITVMSWSGSNGTRGTGSMNDIVQSIPVGGIVTYVVSLEMPTIYNPPNPANPAQSLVNLTNTVTVTSPTTDPFPFCPKCTDVDVPRPDFVTVLNTSADLTVTKLIKEILINSPCISTSGFSASAPISFGYFNRNNSDFPIKDGIVIRTGLAIDCQGKASQTGTVITSAGGSGSGDADLLAINTANGNAGSINDASFVKFNFKPANADFSFNYLFASNEYGTYQCGYSDAFAFILTDLVTNQKVNIALVPNTILPVSVTNVRKALFNGGCPSANVGFFGKYNFDNIADPSNPDAELNSSISMKGQTVKMTAKATVIPNRDYSIKLVIGDYNDTAYDSAVFIEAGSFKLGEPQITGTGALLGQDVDIQNCEGTPQTIQASNGLIPGVTYSWKKDGVLIVGETINTLLVSEPGTYTVTFTYSGGCSQSDDVVIGPYEPQTQNPVNIVEPYNVVSGGGVFNLTQNQATVVGNLNPNDFTFTYFASQADFDNYIPIATPSNYIGQNDQEIIMTIEYVGATSTCIPSERFRLFTPLQPVGTFEYTEDGGEIGFCRSRSPNNTLAPTELTPLTTGGVYSILPNNGIVIDPTTGVINLTDAIPGDYEVTYQIVATGNNIPYVATAPVKIILCTDMAPITTVCGGSSLTLNTSDAGTGVTYTWSDVTPTVIGTTNLPTLPNVIAPSAGGVYAFSVVANYGTINSVASSENLLVNPIPSVTISGATSTCNGNSTIVVFSGTPGSIVNYNVDGAAATPITLDATTGDYSLTTPSLNNPSVYQLTGVKGSTTPDCAQTIAPSSTSTLTISVGEPSASVSVLGANPICNGASSTIRIVGNPGATVNYKINNGATISTTIDTTTGFVDIATGVLTANATYELINITDNSGSTPCTKTFAAGAAKVTVTISPLPTVSEFSTTTAFVCTNTKGKLTFTGTLNSTIVYSDGNTNYNVAIDGTGTNTIDTPNNLTANTTFSLVSITDALACSTTTFTLPNVLIQISAGPTITSQPQATTVCEGPADAILTVEAVGAGLTYQWNDGTSNVGIDSNTLNIPAILANNGKSYTCTITDSCGVAVTSPTSAQPQAIVTVTAKPFNLQDPQGTPPSTPASICVGTTIDLTASASGSGIAYKWFRDTTDLSISNPTALTNHLVINNVQTIDSGNYSYVASNCASTKSADYTITVNPLPTISSFTTSTAFICTNTKGKLTFTGTPNTTIVYSDGSLPNYTVVLNASGTTTPLEIDTPDNLTADTTFSLVSITNNDPTLACSNTNFTLPNVLIQISAGPTITTQPQATTVCEGAADAILTVAALGAGLTYQWNDGTNNVGTNSNTLSVPAILANNGTQYTCRITDACGVFVDSAPAATVNVTAKPVFTQQPQGTSPICAGEEINLNVTTTGVGVTYKWFRGTTDLSTVNLTALTGNLVITNAQTTDSGDYTCVATTCSSVTSLIKTVTVNPLPVVNSFSATNASICTGTKGTLEFTATPNSTIVYSDGLNNFNVSTLTGTVSVSTVNNLTTSTTFTLVSITNNLTSCVTNNLSNLQVTININALPTVSDPTPIATLICSGDPATTLSVVATGSGLIYLWKKDNSIVANSNSSFISVPSVAANTGNYTCTVTDICGQSVTSIKASLTINDAPIVTQNPIGSTICSGTTINLSIVTTGTGLTYQWKRNAVDLPTTNATAVTSNLVIVNAQTTDSGDYTCEAKSGTCSVLSAIAAMTVNQAPQITTQPVSNAYCTGDNITLSVVVSISTVTYQWQFNGTNLLGETNFELKLINVTTANSGDYVCLIDNLPCKQIKSNKAVILVKAPPFATIQTQIPNTTVCAGTDSNLIFNGTPNAEVTYTINGGANQILSLSPSGTSTIITTGILETTTVYQLISVSTNDYSPVCTTALTEAVTINVVAIPEPTLAADGFICIDENNVTLRKFRMETGFPASQYDFQWYEDNVALAAPDGTNDFYDADKKATYKVEITDRATGCKRSAMTKISTSLQPKTVTATVLSGYFDDNATIEITADPINGDYEYQLDYGPFQDSNIFTNVQSGDHNVYARDKQECNTTPAFWIKIVKYPKFFTPNGDGINDYWNISNLFVQSNAKIYIFDRFGKFMKQISTTGQGWDGNFNASPAPADDYWFVIKYEEQQINKEFKAHFTLKR